MSGDPQHPASQHPASGDPQHPASGAPAHPAGDMIALPPGQVTLTDRRTRRSWSVPVAAYELGAVPLTQERYARITGERPSAFPGELLPVESVSWWDAVRCCNSLSTQAGLTPAYQLDAAAEQVAWDESANGYRLPTEAEWEYACRAGTDGARYGELDEIAWHRGNSGERPHEVGGKRPNALGLHDMLGSVWEWCWDFYDPEVYGTYRVLRGGGWFDERWSCRASVATPPSVWTTSASASPAPSARDAAAP